MLRLKLETICLDVKGFFAQNRRDIPNILNTCNWTGTQIHLVPKKTLNHSVKYVNLSKLLSICLRANRLWI